MDEKDKYFKGRGAQLNTHNHFLKHSYAKEFPELIDEDMLKEEQTQYIEVFPRRLSIR